MLLIYILFIFILTKLSINYSFMDNLENHIDLSNVLLSKNHSS